MQKIMKGKNIQILQNKDLTKRDIDLIFAEAKCFAEAFFSSTNRKN